MASVIMNAIKEEAAVSATSVASAASTVASASRSTTSHNIATSAPSARAAVVHASAETMSLFGAGRQEVLQATRTQPALGDLSTTVAESSTLSSVLNSSASSEPTMLKNILPGLRGQMSNAVQQGFEQVAGDKMPQLEPTWGVAETAKKLEDATTVR
ncbi:hypothetical protein FRC10_007335 [Ceratobasidium sp. 414]|nr:hypothetical protein FRC10_007335 [Ceratobasidium sp. 414]